jgi:hypothetical protein
MPTSTGVRTSASRGWAASPRPAELGSQPMRRSAQPPIVQTSRPFCLPQASVLLADPGDRRFTGSARSHTQGRLSTERSVARMSRGFSRPIYEKAPERSAPLRTPATPDRSVPPKRKLPQPRRKLPQLRSERLPAAKLPQPRRKLPQLRLLASRSRSCWAAELSWVSVAAWRS